MLPARSGASSPGPGAISQFTCHVPACPEYEVDDIWKMRKLNEERCACPQMAYSALLSAQVRVYHGIACLDGTASEVRTCKTCSARPSLICELDLVVCLQVDESLRFVRVLCSTVVAGDASAKGWEGTPGMQWSVPPPVRYSRADRMLLASGYDNPYEEAGRTAKHLRLAPLLLGAFAEADGCKRIRPSQCGLVRM